MYSRKSVRLEPSGTPALTAFQTSPDFHPESAETVYY